MAVTRPGVDAAKAIGLQPRELFETVHTTASSLRLHEKLSAREAATAAMELAEACIAVTLQAFQIAPHQEPPKPSPPAADESYRVAGARLVRSAVPPEA